MNQKFKKYFPPFIGILAVFAVWYIVCRAGILSSYVLPSPGRVFQSFCKMLQSGELFRDLRISFLRVGKGFVIAFILAFAFGMLRAMIPASAGYYEYLVQFFRNVPPLSMIPLLILWCGIGETTKTVIIVLASFFPMYLNIVKGFTGCDRKLLEVGTMFGYTERQKFFRIMLPYAMADILVGMRIGLGYSWRAIIGAEMVAASTGLGHMILFAQQMSRTDKVIVGIFAIGIAGYLTDRIFGLLEAAEFRNIDLLINRIRPDMVRRGEMMSVEDVVEILAVNLIGAVPDDEEVVISTNQGEPLVGDDTPAGQAFFNVCRRILGEEVPLMELDRTQGFLSRISGLFHRNR